MKYLKRFEVVHEMPKIGDYVICREVGASPDLEQFVNNNIGKIFSINLRDKYPFEIEYSEKVPENISSKFIDGHTRQMDATEIIYWSDDKKELEMILNSRKYNL